MSLQRQVLDMIEERTAAMDRLLSELEKGRLSGEEEGWLPFEDVFLELLSEPESAAPQLSNLGS